MIVVGTTKSWNPDTYYKNYYRVVRYGKYQYCYSSTWGELPMYGTGGYWSDYNVSYQYFPNCQLLDPGTWSRNASNGNHFTNSAGVGISGILGINLSVDTNYDNSHTISEVTNNYEHICGDNSNASNVNTKY